MTEIKRLEDLMKSYEFYLVFKVMRYYLKMHIDKLFMNESTFNILLQSR
jgi:hypothetical protein